MEVYLSVKEAAALMGCSERTVRNKVEKGELEHEIESGLGVGRGGKQYRIKLSSLDERAQKKYYSQRKKATQAAPKDDEIDVSIEELSAEERVLITERTKLVREAMKFRNQFKKEKCQKDEVFLEVWNAQNPDQCISVRTLRRWINMFRKHGEVGLLDRRKGCNKGRSNISEVLWSVFADYYLDQSQKTISFCHRLTEAWAELERPDLLPIPSRSSFERKAQQIPEAVATYFRYGDKAYEDQIQPYIIRLYDNLASNDIWVADNHTWDFVTRYDDIEKEHRLYITVYLDVRSRKTVGYYVTDTPNSDANLFALKKGISRYGIPKQIYTDNGREFLVKDIGGRGRRKTDKDRASAATILDRLGIEMKNAKVRNGKAKIVERVFKEWKETFSKCINSYTGGNIIERPERLKEIVKDPKKLLKDGEVREFIETFIEGWFNKQEHNGTGMNGRCPDDVYEDNLLVKRVATEDDLNLMMMRWDNIQTVDRLGVKLNLYGQKLVYWDEDLINNYSGKKVFVRYNPEDLREVRVYDEEDRFIKTVQSASETIMEYGASKEEIKAASSKIAKVKKNVKQYKQNNDIGIYENTDALDVLLRTAKKNLEESTNRFEAKIIEPVRLVEEKVESQLRRVSGDDVDIVIDMNRMIENARKNK
ncbi:Mu transposase C-terminal domain-containing protein [Anaerosolibacter sp.]|uniref:Mu transposase C-terminal domain-containing protein n=1 Tax=Anaerosolibacter sp. TaxID=1872527 RepID=UPI0039F13820